jgi:hypothetical protein
MQTFIAMTHVRHGMYRVARSVAWLITIVTFLAIIGHGFSGETDTHTTFVLAAILGASVGVLLLLPSAVHLRYQKTIATILLLFGILACIFL